MDEAKRKKQNLIFYPLGTLGRDMVYQLFANFILTYILFTRNLTAAQLVAVTGIMIAARIFDGFNDPIMGFIIERTRTRWGKFKPWLLIGTVTTAFVIIFIFTTKLQGWSFIVAFGIVYFLYSITYTMHDISYWGMVPALSEDANSRNQFTSRATLFAGIGGTLLNMLVPMLTAGSMTIGGSATTAYGVIATVVGILCPLFMLFTLFGVHENRPKYDPNETKAKLNIGAAFKVFIKNDQLRWIAIIFLIQQIGNGLILGGIGSTYVYFQYGYSGGLYTIFNTVGMMATAFLMLFYPAIARKINRKPLMGIMTIIALVGFALMLISGFVQINSTVNFWILTIGFMASNFGFYCFYLIMMISIFNTVEYNELTTGNREEAVITSLRPFITKVASAIIVGLTSMSYLIFKVTETTNQISDFEQRAQLDASNPNYLSEELKLSSIQDVISGIANGQKTGLLLFMVLIPLVCLLLTYFLYKKKYKLDEDEYDRICKEVEARRNKE